MYTTIQFVHSYWAYLVLVVVVLATLNALIGFFSNKEYSPKDFRISLFGLIVTHIQLLIGLLLYFSVRLTINYKQRNGHSNERLYVAFKCCRTPACNDIDGGVYYGWILKT